MKIYGTLSQAEQNILSSKVSLEKYKKLLFKGDHQGMQNMLLWDAIFIPMIRTIAVEYPAYVLTTEYVVDMGDPAHNIMDMSYFVKKFFKWTDKHYPGRYTSNEDFIHAHKLEKEVGWD